MILRSCLSCTDHEIREELGTRVTFCLKENCWSQYSKCVATRAIERFLEQERVEMPPRFSALSHLYSEFYPHYSSYEL
jgi:hypothetical protein